MIIFPHLFRKHNTYKLLDFKIDFNCKSKVMYFQSGMKDKLPLINHSENNKVDWNFKSIDFQQCKVDCVLVLNNRNFNKNWLKKVITQTDSILLADGGANILYSEIMQNGKKHFQFVEKVKAVIGDLDSLTDEARKFYKSNGVKLIKQFDQQKNDFEKTLMHGLQLGCKNFVVSGAFGSRLDHSLSTISITQKYTKSQKDLYIILSNKYSICCPLRTGVKHNIYVSEDIQKSGCGIVTFQKIDNIETTGFKWNLGKNQKYQSIQWGHFLSTSNEIVEDKLEISFNSTNNQVAYFVACLRHDFN